MKLDDKARAFIGIGIMGIVLGAYELLMKPGPRTGRWSFIWAPLHEHFGAVGVGLVSIGIGVVCLYLGLSRRKD